MLFKIDIIQRARLQSTSLGGKVIRPRLLRWKLPEPSSRILTLPNYLLTQFTVHAYVIYGQPYLFTSFSVISRIFLNMDLLDILDLLYRIYWIYWIYIVYTGNIPPVK